MRRFERANCGKIAQLALILWTMNILYNLRFIRNVLVLWTALCLILSCFWLSMWTRCNLLGESLASGWNGYDALFASAFYVVLWIFFFINIKFLLSARLNETGIIRFGWRGKTLMPWEDVRSVVARRLKRERRIAAFYFTDKNGGVLTIPARLFVDTNQVIDAIELKLPASVSRTLRS